MKSLLTGLLFVFLVIPAYADIYKYVDENGVVCYTDAPFGKKADRILKETNGPDSEKNFHVRPSGTSGNLHHIVHEKASMYHVDPSLIKAVIKTESNWNSRAR